MAEVVHFDQEFVLCTPDDLASAFLTRGLERNLVVTSEEENITQLGRRLYFSMSPVDEAFVRAHGLPTGPVGPYRWKPEKRGTYLLPKRTRDRQDPVHYLVLSASGVPFVPIDSTDTRQVFVTAEQLTGWEVIFRYQGEECGLYEAFIDEDDQMRERAQVGAVSLNDLIDSTSTRFFLTHEDEEPIRGRRPVIAVRHDEPESLYAKIRRRNP